MRYCTFAVIVGLVGRAAAEPPNAMARTDAGSPVCDLLRAGWGSGDSSCETVQTKVVRGLGKVVVWRAQTHGAETWAVTIQAGSDTWESPAISAPGSDCGAGHCNDTTTTPVLHVFHPNGRLAVALEVQIETRWYVNEPPRTPYRLETSSSFLACGSSADGVRRCTTFDGQGCAVKLADNGTITRTCTDRVNFDGI